MALGRLQDLWKHDAADFRLLRHFTVASLAAFLPVAAALVYFDRTEDELIRNAQREQNALVAQMQATLVQRHDAAAPAFLLQVHEAANVNLAQLFANALWEKDFAPFVARAQQIPIERCRAIAAPPGEKQRCSAAIGQRIMALPEFRALDAKVIEMTKRSSVSRIKVFDLRGITVYSSEHRQIGEDKADSAGWQSALAGKTASELVQRGTFEGVVESRDLVASYLPVAPFGYGTIVAVLEVYSDVTPFLEQVVSTSTEIGKSLAANRVRLDQAAGAIREKADAREKLMLAAVLGLLAMLYVALWLIVRRGQGLIDRQGLERERSGLALERQKNLYDVLSKTNKAIVHVVERDALFATVCRIAVEHGRFRFAWIGLLDERDQRLRPVARYGEDAGYLDALDSSGNATPDSRRGLTGRTLLSGAHVVSNDFLNDPATAPWHAAAARAGVRAAAKFPIRQAGTVVGAISLYAGEAGFFAADLIATLEEIAGDVSFALDNYEHEKVRAMTVEALRESETRYRSLFENMLNGFAYCRMLYDDCDRPADFVYLEVNDAFTRLTGLKDVVGRRVSQAIPGIREANPELFEAYGRVSSSGIPETFEIEVKPLRQWFFVSVYSPGKGYFVAVFDVITERRRAEALLRDSEERLRTIFEGALDGILVADADSGRFLTGNPAICRMLGYTPEEVVRLSVADIHPRPDLPRVIAEFEKQKRGESNLAGNTPVMRKDGTVFYADIKSAHIRLGGKDGLLGIFRDTTEQRQSERALRAAEQQFRGLVEQSIAGTYIIQDGTLAYVNPRFAEILGYASADELIGRDPLVVVAEKDRATVRENIRRRLDGEVSSLSYSFSGVRKDGSAIEVGVHGALATYGNRPGIIGLMQDISEKKRAEEQIQRYIVQLEGAFMRTVEVATTLSEMRDPYTAGHERRVAEIAVAIGAELGLDARRQEGLRVAGYLHDIGKITVPSEILAKPGKLSAIEYQLIQQHAQAGFDVLKDVDFPWPVAEVALQHHERLDGSGYPNRLKGDAILLEARILAVADTVEAMASHRPYRPGLGIDMALAEIERGRCRAYDAAVADACLKLFREKGYVIPT